VQQPLAAAGDLQQVAVDVLVPAPGQPCVVERAVERDAMAVTLGVGQRAVDVEDQCAQRVRHRLGPWAAARPGSTACH